MTKELLKNLKKDHQKKKLYGIAKALKLPYSTLYRIAMEQSSGNMSTWEKLEAFYKQKVAH